MIDLTALVNVRELEAAARDVLDPVHFDRCAGGAEQGRALASFLSDGDGHRVRIAGSPR
jgi:hypothetical protein